MNLRDRVVMRRNKSQGKERRYEVHYGVDGKKGLVSVGKI